MGAMAKLLLLGALASAAIGGITAMALVATDASGNVGGMALILAAFVVGLIGAKVAHHLPPPKRQH